MPMSKNREVMIRTLIHGIKACNLDLELKDQCHIKVMNVYETSMRQMSKKKAIMARIQTHVKKTYDFDLKVNSQGHIEVVNVCDTSSKTHPCVKYDMRM